MKSLEKIGTIEAIALIVIVVMNIIIQSFPKLLIQKVGQSSWINVVFISVIVALFVYVILKMYKPFGGNILDLSNFLAREMV